MGKINGTLVLLHADGEAVALQRGLTITAEQDLPDTTNKESGGWAEHENIGLRNATVSFDALFSTTGKSAADLLAYITGRTSLLMVIVGGISYPMIGEVDLSSVSLTGTMEQPAALSGNLKVNGPLYQLKGTSASLVSDPDATGTDYDTFTISDIAITSAINTAGTAYAHSNTFSVTNGDVIKVCVFLTSNSGEVPTVEICESGSTIVSNQESLAAGLNVVTLTVTKTCTAHISLRNTGAANWALSSLYAFKYVAS